MNLFFKFVFAGLLLMLLWGFNANSVDFLRPLPADSPGIINSAGKTIQTRFNVPEGFKRKDVDPASFAAYLRNLPVKPAGSKVKYYDGKIKEAMVYDAVIDMDIGTKNLQQCADAVMRLRGEYLFAQKSYEKISFYLTNGFKVDYREWMKGNRIDVNGNETSWKNSASPSNTYKDFRNYMDLVFTYAGTLSLSKNLHKKELSDIAIGDVFIFGGSPGHAVIVTDMAENAAGEKIFMIAQSYMPAQETQVLKNLDNPAISPWYNLPKGEELITPEWTFRTDQLKSWE